MIVNSLAASPRDAHENNVIGTMNILAACTGADSPVRKFVFKSSTGYYGSEQDDPAFFTERMRRPHPPRTRLERDMVEAEEAVADFADKNPDVDRHRAALRQRARPRRRHQLHPHVLAAGGADGARLRPAASVRARGRRRARARARGPQPDPGRLQRRRRRGAGALGGDRAARQAPAAGAAAVRGRACSRPLRRLGFRIPDEMANLLRFGRGVDNRLYKATGFTTATPRARRWSSLGEHLRLQPVMRGREQGYHYEREVEEFLRWSPHVRREPPERERRRRRPRAARHLKLNAGCT